MSNIRGFRNADLPGLTKVWIIHWSRSGPPPRVNHSIMEQAVLARTFFDPSNLLVAESEGEIQAWCHFFADTQSDDLARMPAICFTDQDQQATDDLLRQAESLILSRGLRRISVGTLRDAHFGYAGLSPLGQGFGIPTDDHTTNTLLGQHGYKPEGIVERMVAQTNPYRMRVSRDMLQFRRSTRVENRHVLPEDPEQASALSSFDVLRYTLVDRRSAEELASIDIWLSDPEAQVMPSDRAILNLSPQQQTLQSSQSYLVGSVLESMAERRISEVETPVDSEAAELMTQLSNLQFRSMRQGACWEKEV